MHSHCGTANVAAAAAAATFRLRNSPVGCTYYKPTTSSIAAASAEGKKKGRKICTRLPQRTVEKGFGVPYEGRCVLNLLLCKCRKVMPVIPSRYSPLRPNKRASSIVLPILTSFPLSSTDCPLLSETRGLLPHTPVPLLLKGNNALYAARL